MAKGSRQKKHSLIQILYLYPIAFFLIGLSIVFGYYVFMQNHRYNEQVEKLRIEFPEKQRAELKSKVLLLKDYINWVRSYPEEHTIQYLNKRILAAEALLTNKDLAIDSAKSVLSSALVESLDKLNAKSVSKIVLLDKNNEVLYPEFPPNSERSPQPRNIPNNSYKIENQTSMDSIIFSSYRNNTVPVSYLISSNKLVANIRLGVSFNADQKSDILKEIVLDSLSKVKYANNEYVIINTFSGFALLSKGKRQIPPLNIKNSSESKWQDIFIKELEFAQQREGGYYSYLWHNRPDVDLSEKISYFSGIKDWQWIIGTGFFTNDIRPVIQRLNSNLWQDIIGNLVRFLAFLILLSIMLYFTMRFHTRKAKSNIKLFLHFFQRAAHGMQVIDPSKLFFTEFDTLAQAANHMIYERERMKSVISAEKSRLRYMIEAIPDLVFFKDTESKFLGCNKAFGKYINRKSEDIIGLSEYDLFEESLAASYIEADMQIIETVKPISSTNWVVYPDGEKCLLYTLKTPYFDSENNLLGIIGISRDITEMEETKQRLILAKEKAEESDRLKTAFLANMSHEIRTPMNAIIGFSDLLADDDLTGEEKIDFILKIKSAGRLLMSIINDIIDIAKIEAGQLSIAELPCDLNRVLHELKGTFEELKNTSGKQDIRLDLILPAVDEVKMIMTDQLRLQQILTNLLSNSLKFTEFGSIEFGYKIQQDTLSFFVKDSGIGIPPNKQELLFQRFSQVDPSSTRKYGGSGLGLAISKNLVELLGGTVGIESQIGKGSIFYFTIPFKPVINAPQKEVKVDSQNYIWNGKTILVAEDILQNYLLIKAVLKNCGVKLIHATNGQIAIDMVKSNQEISLVLMDIQLPVKTGYEALKEILEFRPGLPVISYTAFALPREREKCLSAGFVDFIPKPLKTETLVPLLDKYLQNQD